MRMLRNFVGFLMVLSVLLFVSCGPDFAENSNSIIEADEALALTGGDNVVLVDTQNGNFYQMEHAEGAVNISRAEIVVMEPYPNLVGSKEQIEKVLGSKGISNDTTVVIYDNNKNMDAARLWWTLLAYGHAPDKVKVVSGGLNALRRAGAAIGSDRVSISPATYTAKDFDDFMMATLQDVKGQVDNPDADTCIIDTRTIEEYQEGTIPGSIHYNFENNNFGDGTYRPVDQIRINYLELGVEPDDTVMMFCKTSIRGAQTYLALYNAGYRNLKLYDGAWVEWSSKPSLPVQTPEQAGGPVPSVQDGS
ncbi:MAG: rhodanese-like domain-containing protein [Spirochaetota bacterium]|nr:rhodanese-like domain-containing protein [Spirochaetota bacterium]